MSSYFPNIDPVYLYKRKGDDADPYIFLQQTAKVVNGKVIMKEIPDFQSDVIVKNSSQVVLTETTNTTLLSNQYRVDYSVGITYFHTSLEGQTVTIEYYGTGYVSFPAERVWIETTGEQAEKTLQDLVDNLIGTDVASLESKVGILGELQTTDKSNLVHAVNENVTKLASTVKKVNNLSPDVNGNVTIDVGVKAVSDSTLNGNIIVDGAEVNVYDDAEIVAAIASKADTVHQHTVSDIADLQGTLNSKANAGHGHMLSDITDVDVTVRDEGYVLQWDSSVGKYISKSPNATTVGDITQLPTADKSNVVNAIKEHSGDIQGRAINVKYPPSPIVPAKGDANYYKAADGKWYTDSAYTQLATDDTPTFLAVDALGKAIFCPPGTYFTQGVDLLGFYYGKDAKIIVKERVAFNNALPPSQRTGVRTFVLGSTPQPILNEFYGKNSGSKVQADAYANTSLGENALANLTTGKRNTAIGYQSQLANPTQYSNTSIGADSLSTGRFFTRITAIGENTLKWAGCLDPIKSRHELWVNEYDVYNLYLDPKSDFYRLRTNNPNIAQIIQPTGSPAPTGAQIVNPGGGFPAATQSEDVSANVAIGRNAMLHHVKGSDNVAVGYQALAHSYVANSNTAIGNYALADNLQGVENTAVGKNALSFNQTGTNNVVVGSGSMGSNIFGNRNTVIGSNAGGGFTGDNSIFIGYRAKGLSASASRQFALDYGNDSAPIPYLYGSMSVGSEYFGTRAKEFRLGGDAGANGGVKWITGTGVPNVAAPVGSMYTRTDGGTGSTLYVKESGTGTTGWVAK